MVIAFARAAAITGDRHYALVAARNYDAAYKRAWSPTFGGGLWWWQYGTKQAEKNATTNAPAVIAACELYLVLHDRAELSRAVGLYGWLRAHLFDPRSGEVFDALLPGTGGTALTSRVRFSYDQGSFIGAAGLLYSITGRRAYRADAVQALAYARGTIAGGGVLPPETSAPNKDPGGFKGIFARWAIWFTHTNHISAYDAWFRLNAAAAWSSRDSRNLTGWDWTAPTRATVLYAWDCSSMPAVLECLLAAPQR
jgi:hypothetical protein